MCRRVLPSPKYSSKIWMLWSPIVSLNDCVKRNDRLPKMFFYTTSLLELQRYNAMYKKLCLIANKTRSLHEKLRYSCNWSDSFVQSGNNFSSSFQTKNGLGTSILAVNTATQSKAVDALSLSVARLEALWAMENAAGCKICFFFKYHNILECTFFPEWRCYIFTHFCGYKH